MRFQKDNYLTIEEWQKIANKKQFFNKLKNMFYKPSFNKKLFYSGLGLFVIGVPLPFIPAWLGVVLMGYSFLGISIDYDKYLIKLRRFKK